MNDGGRICWLENLTDAVPLDEEKNGMWPRDNVHLYLARNFDNCGINLIVEK